MNYLDSSMLSEAERERLADAIRAGRRVRLREAPVPPNVACCYFCEGTFDPASVVEHVRGCEKHPLRAALLERDAEIARLRAPLSGDLGALVEEVQALTDPDVPNPWPRGFPCSGCGRYRDEHSVQAATPHAFEPPKSQLVLAAKRLAAAVTRLGR